MGVGVETCKRVLLGFTSIIDYGLLEEFLMLEVGKKYIEKEGNETGFRVEDTWFSYKTRNYFFGRRSREV